VQIGIRFPTREIGCDAGVVREWVAAAAAHGFRHISVSDAVLGVDPQVRPEWGDHFPGRATTRAAFTIADPFHEPLVLLGFLAALTELELATSVLVLPQRQTALVAKQAAEVDILCGGRLRLGVGVGWSSVESDGLGADFAARGRRIEEQILLLRALWTERTVAWEGTYDRIVGAGLAPLPLQRPIPIWIGGYADAVLRRAGRLADGWNAGPTLARLPRALELVRAAAAAAGRDPAALPVEGQAGIGYGEHVDDLAERAERWRAGGATHLTVDAMGAGAAGPAHVSLLVELARRLTLA
jgi:probable F420-dependent oxidoreductase